MAPRISERWQDGGVSNAPDPATVVTTERVIVRPWRPDEADSLFDIHRRIEVVRGWGGTPMGERREATQMIERYSNELASDPRFGFWAVVARASGVPVGTVLLKPLPNGAGEIEIGWRLHPDWWGRGLASEAAAAVLGRGFADGLEEVWAVTLPDNHRSVRVCRRIGMRLLGVTHRWYHEPSLMFWIGSRPDQEPSLGPDEPLPAGLPEA